MNTIWDEGGCIDKKVYAFCWTSQQLVEQSETLERNYIFVSKIFFVKQLLRLQRTRLVEEVRDALPRCARARFVRRLPRRKFPRGREANCVKNKNETGKR